MIIMNEDEENELPFHIKINNYYRFFLFYIDFSFLI